MTINIADNTPRVSYSVAEGVTQTSFTVTFEFFDAEDLNVYVDNTLKTLTTDYTVTGGDGNTGSVSISVTGASGGSTVVITRDIALERTTDFPLSGSFQIQSLNTELDRITAIAADLDDHAQRGLRLQDSDAAASTELPLKADRLGKTLAFNATTGAVEAGPTIADTQSVADASADIATLADIQDGTVATNAITTAANISSNITTVAGIASNVSTVAGISSDVSTVAADSTDISTVATNIASVNTVAGNISEVIAVANDLNEAVSEVETVANDLNEAVSEIETVATSITNVDIVGANIGNVNTVAGISSNVTTVAGISANVTTVAGNSANVTTVAGISSDVTAVAADATDIGTVSSNIANVNTVAGISSNVTTVAGISANVTTVSGISSNVTTVAGVSSDVTTVAGQISPTNNVGTVAGIASDISTVSGISANVTTVAGNTTNINTVAGISANVTTVAGISSDVTAVAADATDIGTVATNLAGTDTIGTVATNISNVNTVAGISANVTTVAGISSDVTAVAADATDIGTVATNIANVNSVGGSISNVNTVASNISSVNDFADKYRIGASDPTTDNDEGDLFYNTTSDTLKVYTGTAWEQGVTAGSGFLPTTGGSLTGDVSFGDNNKAIFGAGSDLQIFHDGFNSVVRDAGTGHLYLQAEDFRLTNNGATATYMKATNSGSVELRHNNNVKFETTSGGIDVTGTVTADGLTVDSSTGITVNGPSSSDGKLNLVAYAGTQNAEARILAARGATSGTDSRLKFYTNNGTSLIERIDINDNGDVSLYADDGTTQGLFWDASTQRLGLGTTAPSQDLHLKKTGYAVAKIDGTLDTGLDFAENGTDKIQFRYRTVDNRFDIFSSTAGGNVLTIADTSGNVGIGTNSPSQKAHIYGGSLLIDNGSSAGTVYFVDTTNYINLSGGSMQFANGGSERMRIDSSGNLLVGTTSTGSASTGLKFESSNLLRVVRDGGTPFAPNRQTSDGTIIDLQKNGTSVGSISVTTSGTTYNTTSDIRLKTDIAPIADATDKLMAMNAVSHKWKAEPDADAVVGFIAQEMAEIVPEAVSKGEGEDDMWSMDYGRITPVLVAALQDAVNEIKTLKERVAELEAK